MICSDKTGTLTRNEMTAVALWLPGGAEPRELSVSGVGYAPVGAIEEAGRAVDVAEQPSLLALLQAGVLCNDAAVSAPNGQRVDWAVLGDPTEAALLVLATKAGLDVDALRGSRPRAGELPFDADTKLMATCHHGDTAPCVIVKGAPEAVLRLLAAGEEASSKAAAAAAEAMAGHALRVLAFAVVDGATLDAPDAADALRGRARLLGLVGQIDPPREQARAAVSECRAAGIRPIMVTGDHKLTALAIARELGIADANDRALDGAQLARMGEPALQEALPHVAVFARVQPAQKLRIVQALQQRGEVVAMTGDGVNDAPALARADVGVAMGIAGTEVAKSAADIVVTDDDFATIVDAVEQGRVVYGNLKKVILYLFATSVDEVLVLLAALVAGLPLPLAAVQILWINIVTEGTLTVNLVMDPPDGDEMRRPPTARTEPLLDRLMLQRTALMALTAAAVAFGWFTWRLRQGVDLDTVRTEVFTLVAVTQWFNVLNCGSAWRSAFGPQLLRNRWLAGGLALSIALQVLVLYAPPLNDLFHTVPLVADTLLPLLLLGSSVLWVEEARKFLGRRRLRAAAR
jgi:magnesium-transporting ATPase (P-type)